MDDEEKCVIDTNALVAERIEAQESLRRSLAAQAAFDESGEEGEDGFVSGIGGEAIDALFDDGAGSGSVIKAEAAAAIREEAEAEAQAILQEAQARAEQILEEARREGERLKANAVEEGASQGYEQGYQQGMAETEGMKQELAGQKRQLEAEFDELLEHLEPKFIETITDVYRHIFAVDLMDNRDIIVHLIDSTLRKVESSRTFIVHVSAEDYPHVNMQKQSLVEGAVAGRGLIEIIEDIALAKGDCLIETDGGIFDCGIGTQLEELTKKLQMLSYEKI